MVERMIKWSLALLRGLDRACNRLYGWRYNPLYQTGTLVVLLLIILLTTGVYLLLFYRVGSPWGSVAALTDQEWGGRWIRTLHRYASDAAIPAIAIHAFRMFAQRRSWGPRTLAWVSGVLLTGVFFLCGWTGYVMVWDVQGQLLAIEGARLLDVLPIFSEPIGRTFVGTDPLPGAFFFMNLFLHIVLPVGVGIVLWLHVSRLARPTLMPPKGLAWGATTILVAFSVLWPIGMAAPAAVSRLPTDIPLDVFYGFWVPISRTLPGWAGWLIVGAAAATVLMIPTWTRPSEKTRPRPSFVDERFCTECVQCSLDCPYEAISMVPREDGRFDLVARVDPRLCVSCGICAGSCAPMGVGPPGRTGRDQLATVRQFLERERPGPRDVVVAGCSRSGDWAIARSSVRCLEFPTSCAGSLHSSSIELLIRSGVGGVAIVPCAPRDCWNREGPKWFEARIHGGREAELKPRVDRGRIRILDGAILGSTGVVGAIERFRAEIEAAAIGPAEETATIDMECAPEPIDPSTVTVRSVR